MVSKLRSVGAFGVLLCAIIGVPGDVRAEEVDAGERLDEATEQLEALRYDEAREGFFTVIASGSADSEQLAKAYFSLGIVEAALNNGTSAIDAFYLALMIQPSLALGLGGSPKIEEFLNQARDRIVAVGALSARLELKMGQLDILIENDPLNIVKAITVSTSAADGEAGQVSIEPGQARVEIDSSVESVEVTLADETGNQLKVLSLETASVQGVDTGIADSSSPWSSWGLWAGVAAAGVGSGAYFLMRSGARGDDASALRQDGSTDTTRIGRLEDDETRLGTYGLIGFGVAGAAALTAGAIVLFGEETQPESEGDVAWSPRLGPGTWGADVRFRF